MFSFFRSSTGQVPTLEEGINQEERVLGRREFLRRTLAGTAATVALASMPAAVNAMTASSNKQERIVQDFSIKEYSSLSEAMQDYELTLGEADSAINKIRRAQGNREINLVKNSAYLETFVVSDVRKYRLAVTLPSDGLEDNLFALNRVARLATGRLQNDPTRMQINIDLEQGDYIQFSANMDDQKTIENIVLLKKLGYRNVRIQRDESGMLKTLVGPYDQETAAAQARNLLESDDVLDVLDTNELGVVSLEKRGSNYSTSWKAIVKEIKAVNFKVKAEVEKIQKRIEKRGKTRFEAKKQSVKFKSTSSVYSMEQIEGMIRSAVNQYNAGRRKTDAEVPFELAKAIAYCESTFNPDAIGYKIKNKERVPAGRGLFQLLPDTANDRANERWNRNANYEELFVPEKSAELGVAHIGYLLNTKTVRAHSGRENQLKAAIALFNGGFKALKIEPETKRPTYTNPKHKGYAETRNYVVKVWKTYQSLL